MTKAKKRKIAYGKGFEKSFQRFIKNNPNLKLSIEKTILLMEENVFSSTLKTHKLSGKLYGLNACSCGYDCRIIFSIVENKETKEEIILLIDIGTHEEVY